MMASSIDYSYSGGTYITFEDSFFIMKFASFLMVIKCDSSLLMYMPKRKTSEEMDCSFVQCLLYIFQYLSHKMSNATNSLYVYIVVTEQSLDMLGEDFSEIYRLTERLTTVEDLAKVRNKRLTKGIDTCSPIVATI